MGEQKFDWLRFRTWFLTWFLTLRFGFDWLRFWTWFLMLSFCFGCWFLFVKYVL